MWWVVNATPRPLYHWERPRTHCTGAWVGPRRGLDGCGKPRPTGNRFLDRPVRSKSLYQLSHSGPFWKRIRMESGESYRVFKVRLGCMRIWIWCWYNHYLNHWFICRSLSDRLLQCPGHHCRGTQTVGPSFLQGQMAAQSDPGNISDYCIPGTLTTSEVMIMKSLQDRMKCVDNCELQDTRIWTQPFFASLSEASRLYPGTNGKPNFHFM